MFALLWLGLVCSTPSPDRYFIDLSLGSWKQLHGNVQLEFLGDGSAKVNYGSWTVLPEIAKIDPIPELVLPAPIWRNHRWSWKGAFIREADWEWQLLKDTIHIPAHWLGGKRGDNWSFVQFKAPYFLLPPAPDPYLLELDRAVWKNALSIAAASGKTKKICRCLAQIDFPDQELAPTLNLHVWGWNCLQPHARLRLALLLGYTNAEIQTLLKK
jgi:hypothetical protein